MRTPLNKTYNNNDWEVKFKEFVDKEMSAIEREEGDPYGIEKDFLAESLREYKATIHKMMIDLYPGHFKTEMIDLAKEVTKSSGWELQFVSFENDSICFQKVVYDAMKEIDVDGNTTRESFISKEWVRNSEKKYAEISVPYGEEHITLENLCFMCEKGLTYNN